MGHTSSLYSETIKTLQAAWVSFAIAAKCYIYKRLPSHWHVTIDRVRYSVVCYLLVVYSLLCLLSRFRLVNKLHTTPVACLAFDTGWIIQSPKLKIKFCSFRILPSIDPPLLL